MCNSRGGGVRWVKAVVARVKGEGLSIKTMPCTKEER